MVRVDFIAPEVVPVQYIMVVAYLPRHRVDAQAAVCNISTDVASFAEPMERVRVSIEREYSQRVIAAEERPKMDYLFDVDRAAAATKGITGRERLTRLNEALDSYGLTRSKNQRWYTQQQQQQPQR